MLLIANVASRNWQDFWIGATLTKVYNDAGMVKIWIWEGLDKIVKYDDWGFNEPSNKGGCAAVKASDGTWFADDCSTTKNYVCSIPVKLDVCDNEWIYFPVTKFCYKVFFHADYNAAESNCVVLGAHLVSIHSKEEDVFVQDISQCGINFGNDGGEATLIGLYEVGSDGTKWNWTDGSPTNYVPWTPPEPNFVSTDKCTSVYADPTNGALTGYWNNMPCSWQMRNYVCKKSPIAVEIK
uniref:C-type lectin domain-containing protein n=1 Tax=Panagrolaimus sp. JU765 TaxID=591449 RepID=A0AC34RD62_9BILA